MYFFFPRKSLKSTHSLKFKSRKKNTALEKKKTTFSLTHSIFDQKWQKFNFSREIKKYGTFDPGLEMCQVSAQMEKVENFQIKKKNGIFFSPKFDELDYLQ